MIAGPGGWWLTAPGAALHVEHRVAVIADVHLGYEWARARGGDCLPPHSLRETLAKLEQVLRLSPIDRLVVAGDLVESPRRCRQTEADLRQLYQWLASQGVELVPILGNHDPQGPGRVAATLDVSGWLIHHGHRASSAPQTISGHLHPVLRAGGLQAPCFVVGSRQIILPAFTANAAGLPLGSPTMPVEWNAPDYRCLASLDETILDFGPIPQLLSRVSNSSLAEKRR